MVRFSIITPVFNGEKFLRDNIDKLQLQTYRNFEHIIVDGGSTDKTVEILESYSPKVKFISEKDNGQSDAINKGFHIASGEVVTWLGVDDYYSDNSVLERVSKYFNDKQLRILQGRCKVIYLDTGVESLVPNPEVTEHNLIKWWNENSVPPQPSIFFRKELLTKYGLLDETLHYCMDHDLWLRFLSNGEKFTQVDDLFSIYQIHSESKTGSSTSKFVHEHDKVAKRYWGSKWQLKYYKHLAEYLYAKRKFKNVFKHLEKK